MATTPVRASGPSPLAAAEDAATYAKQHLFPFDLNRWFVLGFAALLDQCARGGMGGGGGFPGGPGGGGGFPGGDSGGSSGSDQVAQAIAWLSTHAVLIAAITGGVLLLIVALSALIVWINSRGTLVYLDNVITGRAQIADPWSRHAEAAGSYFAWRFMITLAVLVGVLALILCGVVGLASMVTGRMIGGTLAVVALVVLVPGLLILLVAAGLLSVALRDFVAPLQLVLRTGCSEAMRVFWTLVRAQPGVFVVYILLKIVYGLFFSIAFTIVCCATCACALLPVVGQTIFQPVLYFERAWSLFLLRQLGHDVWAALGATPPAPARL